MKGISDYCICECVYIHIHSHTCMYKIDTHAHTIYISFYHPFATFYLRRLIQLRKNRNISREDHNLLMNRSTFIYAARAYHARLRQHGDKFLRRRRVAAAASRNYHVDNATLAVEWRAEDVRQRWHWL